MDILVEKNGRCEPKPIVLDRRTEGQKKVTTTKFVLLLFCLKKVSPVLLFLAGLVGGGEGWAAVRLPKLVGDRMVLQRETELKIWGFPRYTLLYRSRRDGEMARHVASATARRTVSDGSE